MISGLIKREARDPFENSGMESTDYDYVHIVKNASEDYPEERAIIVQNPNLKTDTSELSNNYGQQLLNRYALSSGDTTFCNLEQLLNVPL